MTSNNTVDLAAAGLEKFFPGSSVDGSATLAVDVPGYGTFRPGYKIPLSLFDVGGPAPTWTIKDTHTVPGTFTLCVFDPDAPRPTYLHELVTDAPAVDPARGTAIVPWSPPAPPGGTHRYVCAAYRQPAPGAARPVAAPKARVSFQPAAFAKEHGLVAVAATWFEVAADEE